MLKTLENILHSTKQMPLWVSIWIFGILVPINAASAFFTDDPVGEWVLIAAILVILFNMPMLLLNGGFSKVLAIPHLIIWGPLAIYLGNYLVQNYEDSADTAIYQYALAVFIANFISLLFDVKDTKEWLQGSRDVFGFSGGERVE